MPAPFSVRNAVDAVMVGDATLMLGDCIERMRELPDESVHLVLVDVPYSSGAAREAGKTANKTMTRSTGKGGRDRWFGSDSLTTRGFMELLRLCAMEWQRLLVPGGHLLSFIDWRMKHCLGDAMEEAAEAEAADRRAVLMEGRAADTIETADLRRIGEVVWNKSYPGQGRHFRRQHENILHFSKGTGLEPLHRRTGSVLTHKPVRFGLHPTEKPEALLGEIIEHVCPVGGLVLDCFAGSFSTGRAAVARGRRFVGIERDRRFFEIGWQQLAQLAEAA